MTTRKARSIDDLYGGGESGNLIHPDFDTPKVHEWLQRRHVKGRKLIDEDGVFTCTVDGCRHRWKVPYGVRQALKQRLVYNQLAVKYPFYVTWISPKTGKRHKKYVSCIVSGIQLITTRIQYHDPDASIVSRTVGYPVPVKLRGKLPRRMNGKMMYWCPLCMNARSFRRARPFAEFYAIKKVWSEDKGRYVWKERKLALLECMVCGCTNRDSKFRASNQPYELRKIKAGVRRIKRRT